MSLFDEKNIKPMLIGAEGKPFDSADFIFELKLAGNGALLIWTSMAPSCGTNATTRCCSRCRSWQACTPM